MDLRLNTNYFPHVSGTSHMHMDLIHHIYKVGSSRHVAPSFSGKEWRGPIRVNLVASLRHKQLPKQPDLNADNAVAFTSITRTITNMPSSITALGLTLYLSINGINIFNRP